MAGQTVLLREKDVTREAVPSNIAILGFGTVGSSVARILADEQLPSLKLVQVFNRNVERKRASWVDPSVQWTQNFQDVLRSNADVVVEVMGGVDPARDWIGHRWVDSSAGRLTLTHLEGAAWTFVSIQRWNSWNDYGKDNVNSIAQMGRNQQGGWFKLRSLISFHTDTLCDRIAP